MYSFRTPLRKDELDFTNGDIRKLLLEYGINTKLKADGNYEVSLITEMASSEEKLSEGWRFIMSVINEQQSVMKGGEGGASYANVNLSANVVVSVFVQEGGDKKRLYSFLSARAAFGEPIGKSGGSTVDSGAIIASPEDACEPLQIGLEFEGKVVIVKRGICTFAEKARMVEKAKGIAMVVYGKFIAISVGMSWIPTDRNSNW